MKKNIEKVVRVLVRLLAVLLVFSVICAVFAVIGYVIFTYAANNWVLQIFFGVIEILLIFGAFCFVLRTIATRQALKHIRKEYSLAPIKVKPGHPGESRAEIGKRLNRCRMEYISLLCICLAFLYAIFDCFTWIMR